MTLDPPTKPAVRDDRPSSGTFSREQQQRNERKPATAPKKKHTQSGNERPVKNADTEGKPSRPQPLEGTQTKKPFYKRRRGGRGKSK